VLELSFYRVCWNCHYSPTGIAVTYLQLTNMEFIISKATVSVSTVIYEVACCDVRTVCGV